MIIRTVFIKRTSQLQLGNSLDKNVGVLNLEGNHEESLRSSLETDTSNLPQRRLEGHCEQTSVAFAPCKVDTNNESQSFLCLFLNRYGRKDDNALCK